MRFVFFLPGLAYLCAPVVASRNPDTAIDLHGNLVIRECKIEAPFPIRMKGVFCRGLWQSLLLKECADDVGVVFH